MGLASFNRARREKADINIAEAERFRAANEANWAGKRSRDVAHKRGKQPLDNIREMEAAASARIGAKNEYAAANPDKPDPLKLDHAAEIAAQDVQGAEESKDPVDRARERLAAPQHEARVAAAETVVTEGETFSPEAEAAKSEPGSEEGGTDIPENWRSYHAAEMRDLAAKLGLGDFETGRDAREAIEAEEERRRGD